MKDGFSSSVFQLLHFSFRTMSYSADVKLIIRKIYQVLVLVSSRGIQIFIKKELLKSGDLLFSFLRKKNAKSCSFFQFLGALHADLEQ